MQHISPFGGGRGEVWKYLGGLLLFLLLTACGPSRYIAVDTQNPAAVTFPKTVRRVLIVNNAVSQQNVPFESSYREVPDTLKISADSTTFDFCRTLGEAIADFPGFDDIRLLEGCFRTDQMALTARYLTRNDVEALCDEHEVDAVISLDRLLFKLDEFKEIVYGVDVIGMINVKMDGVVRVYLPNRNTPMTTIILADTITPDISFEPEDMSMLGLFFSADHTNLLRESARFLAEEARIHFVPYWTDDIRWYYAASDARWKEASACAVSDRWDKALQIWKSLYDRTTSWKKRARLASNLALGMELTGDLEQALTWANISHQLFLEHGNEDDTIVKKQELYVRVLSHRILDDTKIRLQME